MPARPSCKKRDSILCRVCRVVNTGAIFCRGLNTYVRSTPYKLLVIGTADIKTGAAPFQVRMRSIF